ncbi:MAG: imidazolonepropionase [Oscillospiraceae bacterium]|nr:imidazolonepropionase [Oscillospiraceae bacterium]
MKNKKEKADLVIKNASQLLTCSGDAPYSLGVINNGWLAAKGGIITVVGREDEILSNADISGARVVDATGKVVAPGFVDCHTHLVFAGSRVDEYAARMTIDDVETLHKMGIKTGIMATADVTREASEDMLFFRAAARLREMIKHGTTTVESKSGYGLTTKDEIKILKVNGYLNQKYPIDVISTFLGAHMCPSDIERGEYLRILIHEMIPLISRQGLARFCDVWCENIAFTVDECEHVLRSGVDHGMIPRLHTDQYSYLGGSDLAASIRASSADHLNYTPKAAVKKMAATGVIGVLLPGIDFAGRSLRPFNARMFIEEGLIVALATNLCPGGWTISMQLVMALACRINRMSPEEAIWAATCGGAKALRLDGDRGALEAGKLADIQIWDVDVYQDAIYRLGGNVVDKVFKRGEQIYENIETMGRTAGDMEYVIH